MQPVNDNSAGAIDARKRKLLFRAWHRGTKEMDLLLGGFAKERLDGMDEAALDAFEALLHIPDQDFYNMLVKADPIPDAYDGPMMRALLDYAAHRFE
ncbi:MAG: succinate dehydrogenase assembly factor 2 [Alphaproteobacteria bacterium]|nr:succinate dehydrogenase assembly factor 2 [Alphaproteobacteria bacterium]